ncbi:MAG: tetratricopeptide repeat protein, partial [Chloroflexi bacterium]|nr:tetratricopeptide repeat protein [Chloroflexota bacterium]
MMGRTHHLADATGHPAGGVAVLDEPHPNSVRPRAESPRPRRAPRALTFLAAAVLIAVGSYLAPVARDALFGAPGGSGPKELLAVPGQALTPDGRLPLTDRIAFWTQRVTEQPSDDLSWLQLAAAYSEQGRLRVDLDAYARALQAANRALEIAPKYPPGLAVRGSILFATHDFAGAELDARAALANSPRDPIAKAILGDSLIELGRVAEAALVYDELAAVAGGPTLDIRRARLAYVSGHPSDALELARKALQGVAGAAASPDPVELAFYHAALGEYARLRGDAATARTSFRAALALRPDDLAALIGLARVEAAAGQIDVAIGRLEAAAAIAPLPEIEALLGDLHQAGGDASAASAAFETVRLTGQLSELAGTVFDRQLILFDLDHGAATAKVLQRAEA